MWFQYATDIWLGKCWEFVFVKHLKMVSFRKINYIACLDILKEIMLKPWSDSTFLKPMMKDISGWLSYLGGCFMLFHCCFKYIFLCSFPIQKGKIHQQSLEVGPTWWM